MKSEILCPAGNFEAIEAGIEAGADSFYLGFKSFNARMRAKNFSIAELSGLIPYLHHKGKKVYITLNTVIKNCELTHLMDTLYYLNDIKPDALIINDLGLLNIIKQFFPELECHASTQMSIYNLEGAKQAKKLGFSRVILARELTLNEIKYIVKNTDVEIEVFVHGALCYSYAGMCQFSSYLGGKSGLRGNCTQPCRRNYRRDDLKLFPFSTCDLNTIEYIPQLLSAGIKLFKIEGRLKDSNYVYNTVSAYRTVIDKGSKNIKKAKELIAKTTSREQSEYFIGSNSTSIKVNEKTPGGLGNYIGKIKKKNFQKAVIVNKTKLNVNDKIRIQKSNKGDGKFFTLSKIYCNGVSLSSIDADNLITIEVPFKFNIGDDLYKTKNKEENKIKFRGKLPLTIPKKYRDPKSNLKKLKMQYRKTSSIIEFMKKITKKSYSTKKKNKYYFIVNDPEQIHFILNKIENSNIIFEINQENKNHIMNNFHYIKKIDPSKISFSLFPIILNSETKHFSTTINKIISYGYKQFLIENLSHLSFFERNKIKLISGIHLRCFNNSSIKKLNKMGFSSIMLHYESDKNNFRSLLSLSKEIELIVPVFGAPELFFSRVKTKVGHYISDNNESYYTNLVGDITVTVPEKPFSFSKHMWNLKQFGASSFSIDMRNYPLNEGEIQKLVYYLNKSKLLKNTKPFNFNNDLT